MQMINSIIIEGNVSKEIKLAKDAHSFISGELEIEHVRSYKTADGEIKNEESVYSVFCCGNLAEHVQKHASKGRGVRVVGRLKLNRWKDETGKLNSRIVIIAEHIEFKPVKE